MRFASVSSSLMAAAAMIAVARASSSHASGQSRGLASVSNLASRGRKIINLGLHHGHNETHRNGSAGVYRLTDLYNSSNFFDKFDFIESRPGTDDYFDVDPTNGFVLYQNRSEAERLGLVRTVGDVSEIRPDTTTVINNPRGYGRRSVRIESKAVYNHALVIADFSHLPQPQCGMWTAYWMYGPNWPNNGELDIYEQWNAYDFNRQTMHTGASDTVGNCTFNTTDALGTSTYDMSNSIHTANCDVYASDFAGCSSWDYEGPYGAAGGGIYAMEWTSDHIKMWTWTLGELPADVLPGNGPPRPDTWGPPGLLLGGPGDPTLCDIDRVFRNHSIVLNIDFCGSTAADAAEWSSRCARDTGYNSCPRYVAANPAAFAEVWFGVRTIKVYTRS